MQDHEDFSEDDNITSEIENPILGLIDDIENKSYTSASNTFHNLLNDKLQDALDAKKIAIASQVFGSAEEEDLDLEKFLEDETV